MRFIRGIVLGTIAGALAGLILYLIQQRQRQVISLEYQPEGQATSPAETGRAKDPKPAQQDDLRRIRGIGPVYARRLQEAGVRTFSQLASQSPEALAEVTGVAGGSAVTRAWIAEARKLAAA